MKLTKLQTGLMSASTLVLAASMAVAAPQGTPGSTGSSSMGQSTPGQSPTGQPGSGSAGTGSSQSSQGSGTSSGKAADSSSGMGSSSSTGSDSRMDSSRTGSPGAAGGASGTIADADRRFIKQAAAAGMLEVEAGRLAATRAQDPQLKSFAQRMVTEHTQNNQKLMTIAQANGVTPPTELDSKHKAMLDKLQRAQGAEFDREYAQLMDTSHQETVQKFERARNQVQDPQLKTYVQSTLPTLHEHHRMAQTLPGAKGSKQAMSERGSQPSSMGGGASGGSSTSGSGSMPGSSSSSSGSSSMPGSSSSSSGSSSMPGSSSSSPRGSSSSGSSSTPGGTGTSPNSTPPDTGSTPPPSTRP